MSSFELATECIYCGATEDLAREHIIPYGLGGTLVLPNGSCKRCAAITSNFERAVLRGFMSEARVAGNFPTRRPKDRPESLSHTLLEEDGTVREVIIPIDQSVGAAIIPTFEPAGRLEGRPYGRGVLINGTRLIGFGTDPKDLVQKHGAKGIQVSKTVEATEFARMIAKIGYAYYVAVAGQPPRDEVPVLPLILDGVDDGAAWVGSREPDVRYPGDKRSHHLALDELTRGDEVLHVVRVFLFSNVMDVTYEVVVRDPAWRNYTGADAG